MAQERYKKMKESDIAIPKEHDPSKVPKKKKKLNSNLESYRHGFKRKD